MGVPILRSVSIAGLRTLGDVRLDLGGLTVLIGENGSGKSSILEGLEILRKLPEPNLLNRMHHEHLAPAGLLRFDAASMALGAEVAANLGAASYRAEFGVGGPWFSIFRESAARDEGGGPTELLLRQADAVRLRRSDGGVAEVSARAESVLSALPSDADAGLRDVRAALAAIDVQVPFASTAAWARRAMSQPLGPRGPQELQRTDRLAVTGDSLPSSLHFLRNEIGGDAWQRCLAYLRLGLSPDIVDVYFPAGTPGSISLQLGVGASKIPSSALSDGELAFLCLATTVHLAAGTRSVLALDEPELHMHPGMIARAVSMLESAAESTPIVVATQSDALLNCLSDPAGQVVVCDLEMPERRTGLRRLDPEKLSRWMRKYSGFAQIRAAGYARILATARDEA